MIRRTFFAVAVALCLAAGASPKGVTLAQLDAYKAVFTQHPTHVPTGKTPDGPLAGNGDIGLTMKTSSEGMVFYIGKNDFWRALESYPEGGIALPGALALKGDEVFSGTYHAEQLPGSAEIRANYTSDGNVLKIQAWVAATDNKVIIELESQKPMELDVAFLPTKDGGVKSIIEQGISNGCSWMTRSFTEDPRLLWKSHVAMALNRETGKVVLKPGKRQILVLSIYTNIDTKEWKQKTLAEAEACMGKNMKALKKAHRSWWTYFWNLSHVSISDEWMERYYYQSQYLLACSSREGKIAPGLWGSFISNDDTAWAGDFHLNYNYQSPYWGCYSSNQICLADNYDQPLLDYMEKGKKYAKELLGCRGLYYPVGIGPFGLSSAAWPDTDEKMKAMYGYDSHMLDGGNMFWGQKSNASFGAVNMMMRFYATWDKDYAQRIYPYILGCAEFWESFLVMKNGRYESVNDTFWEEHPGRGNDNDVNPMCSLGLIRMVMRGALDLSDFLGKEEKGRQKWNDILDKLSPFPVGKTDDGRLSLKYCDRKGENSKSEDMKPSGMNRVHMHGVLIPPMVSGPIINKEFADIMLDDLKHWPDGNNGDWINSMGNGVETVYAGAARLGFEPSKILSYLRKRIEKTAFPNCYIEASGGGIETLAAVPFTINEMLMQSYEGILRIFPCWMRRQNASFRHLRANGAFLVSASINNGIIGEVELLSEQGKLCKMENPWSGKTMSVRHANGKIERLQGRFVEFSTKKNEKLRIFPE